jgi:hypothetical protein
MCRFSPKRAKVLSLAAMLSGVGVFVIAVMTLSQEGGFASVSRGYHGIRETVLILTTALAGLLQFAFSLLLFCRSRTAAKLEVACSIF